ncbi:hypothetical protein K431DRAFT_46414 [Polychaeton citri CBS 116435]|uniref:Uncharacterized protein n=1 Tax=Polychaeton citri CBS 116435 TaxID=1314669 RepID=A0A9P4Q9L0_9PEZI|nr:hypothetical protein K431DRAFT_46414 [Polychaeton citri CBS 116435]
MPNTAPPTETEDTETSYLAELGSTTSRAYPGPPVNSPEGTVYGEVSGLDTDSITERLARSFGTATTLDDPSIAVAEQAKPACSKSDGVEVLPAGEGYHPEYSTWEQIATEDVGQALMRLAMLAKDEHKRDGSRSIEDIYSAHLARLIQDAEIAFDPKHLD